MPNTPRKLNVVVVDDDSGVVRLVEKFLATDLGERIKIITFTDAREACDWIDNHSCDILLSDIEMPGLDGLETLKFAKHRNAWTQVVFMTAHSTWDRIAESIENGAADYLLKPIDRAELTAVIAQECARLTRWQNAVSGTFRAANAKA